MQSVTWREDVISVPTDGDTLSVPSPGKLSAQWVSPIAGMEFACPTLLTAITVITFRIALIKLARSISASLTTETAPLLVQ